MDNVRNKSRHQKPNCIYNWWIHGISLRQAVKATISTFVAICRPWPTRNIVSEPQLTKLYHLPFWALFPVGYYKKRSFLQWCKYGEKYLPLSIVWFRLEGTHFRERVRNHVEDFLNIRQRSTNTPQTSCGNHIQCIRYHILRFVLSIFSR